MVILNNKDKVIYTNEPYKANWLPYLTVRDGGIMYFQNDGKIIRVYDLEEYFCIIESMGFTIKSIDELQIGVFKSIVEISKYEYIVNGEKIVEASSLGGLLKKMGYNIDPVRYSRKDLTLFEQYKETLIRAENRCVIDHLGNKFRSKAELCKYYGIGYGLFEGRIKNGWSLEKALTTKTRKSKHKVIDHQGNEFESKKEMAEFYGVPLNRFIERRKKGWGLEKSLSPIVNQKIFSIDHLGNEFDTRKEMLEYWGITKAVFTHRTRNGWDLERTLTTPIDKRFRRENQKVVYKGETYSSRTELARKLGIPETTFFNKLNKGFSVEEIIEQANGKVEDHLGNIYPSVSKMCSYYGLEQRTFRYRRKRGMSLEESLTTPVKGKK